MQTYITSITEAIGNTPLLRLDKLCSQLNLDGEIYAKLEHLNPSFSKKDRIALGMIELAEKKGDLKPGQPVLEVTSGNTGTGLALVCAAKGYRFICCMSIGNSIERVKMVQAFGGETVLVKQAPGAVKGKVSNDDLMLVEEEAQRIAKETGAYCINRFHNTDSSYAQEPAAAEMWEQSEGKLSAFADFIGTGGTFAGYARYLKTKNADIKCYAVEPMGCAYYGDDMKPGAAHRIQGGGYAKAVENVERNTIDGCITISDDEAVEMTRKIAAVEGIFAGFSSGSDQT
jgi:cysteine synthase A